MSGWDGAGNFSSTAVAVVSSAKLLVQFMNFGDLPRLVRGYLVRFYSKYFVVVR